MCDGIFAYLVSCLSNYLETESMSEAGIASYIAITYVDHLHSDEDLEKKIMNLRWLTLNNTVELCIGNVFQSVFEN